MAIELLATNIEIGLVTTNLGPMVEFYEKLLGAKFQHQFTPAIHSVVLPGGGGWLSPAGYCRSAHRYHIGPGGRGSGHAGGHELNVQFIMHNA